MTDILSVLIMRTRIISCVRINISRRKLSRPLPVLKLKEFFIYLVTIRFNWNLFINGKSKGLRKIIS